MQDINFFDHYQLQEEEARKLKPGAFVVIASILMLGISGVLFYQSWQLKNDISELEMVINNPEIQVQLKEAQKLEQDLTTLTQIENQVNNIVTNIDKKDANITQYLLEISKVMPKTVTLDQTTLNANLVVMDAQAVTRQAIAEFQHNLKELGIFSDVYISTIQPTSSEGFNFQIQCQIGGSLNENE
ncbi:MAG: PilN domain-containing protein [Culicoidibacterales bacterium]